MLLIVNNVGFLHMTHLVFIEYQQWKNWSIGSGAGFPIQWSCVQSDHVAPRLGQPFILLSLIKWVPEISRNWVIKSQLPPCSGSVDFRQLNLKGALKFFFEEDTRNITLAAINTIWMFLKFEFYMEKKQEPPNEAFQRGIWNKLWISKRTKQLRMNLKRHLTMKYLGILNTRYLVFTEYQQRKCKNTLWPL